MTHHLLEVRDLVKKFPIRGGFEVSAVNGVSFSIAAGESVGLVGESGSGKSTLGMLITRLTSVTSGQILFAGEDITQLPEANMREIVAFAAKRQLVLIADEVYQANVWAPGKRFLSFKAIAASMGAIDPVRSDELRQHQVLLLLPLRAIFVACCCLLLLAAAVCC